jgi:hypothetical protein
MSVHNMQRILQPELLDSLPVDHPAALHNRRDLRLINKITGNDRWIARTLSRSLGKGERALELGAGTGDLGRRLHAKGVLADGLDLWPPPKNWPAAREWHVADLRSFQRYGQYGAVFGNLIFHQFSESDLAAVGAQLRQSVRVIVACEPARRRALQVLFRLFGSVIGANYVSLHDGHVSIAAGFRSHELARSLGLRDSEWDIRQTTSLLGMYRMVAERRG